MSNEIVSYNVGDWVFVDGYGNGFIVKIEMLEFEEDMYSEIEFTVHLKGHDGKWADYYADLEDITLLPAIVVDKEMLLDIALQARDYEWCKQLVNG